MTSDTVTIPISAIIFLGGALMTCLGGLFTTCAHLLIGINRSLTVLSTDLGIRNTKTDSRLELLERHDANNEEEKRWALRHDLLGRQQAEVER